MNDPRGWLERAENYAKHAWHGPWTYELDDYDRVTLHAHGPVPFDLIQFDDYRGPTEDIEFITAARAQHPAMVAALTAVLDLIDNDSWVESAEFGLVNVVNADDIREAITDHLKDTP